MNSLRTTDVSSSSATPRQKSHTDDVNQSVYIINPVAKTTIRLPISASDRIPGRFCVISMEFLSLSRRRSSSRNVPQRRWARRNVCRSQAIKWKGREFSGGKSVISVNKVEITHFFIFAEIASDIRLDGQQLIKTKVSIPRVTGKFPRSGSNVTSTTRFFDFDTHGLLDWTFLKAKYCANLARSLAGKQLKD